MVGLGDTKLNKDRSWEAQSCGEHKPYCPLIKSIKSYGKGMHQLQWEPGIGIKSWKETQAVSEVQWIRVWLGLSPTPLPASNVKLRTLTGYWTYIHMGFLNWTCGWLEYLLRFLVKVKWNILNKALRIAHAKISFIYSPLTKCWLEDLLCAGHCFRGWETSEDNIDEKFLFCGMWNLAERQ